MAVCSGSVRDCKELNNDDIQICYGDSDLRRYHYLKYSDGKQYGLKPKTQCSSINDVINSLIISKTFDFGNLEPKIHIFRPNHGDVGSSSAAVAIASVMIRMVRSDISVFMKLCQMWNKISRCHRIKIKIII